MNKGKWYEKLLIGLIAILFSPLIILALIVAGICVLFQTQVYKKEYKRSPYYADLKQKFMKGLMESSTYRFYNSAAYRKLPIQYIKQEINGFEYFIFNKTVYLFPDFEQIDMNDKSKEWRAYYRGKWKNLYEAYANLLSKLDAKYSFPVKLLVERSMVNALDLSGMDIPDCVFVTWSYENAFENEDSPLKMIVPQSSKELYNMMLQAPNICGAFALTDKDEIIWKLYENIEIELYLNDGDGYIGIVKTHSVKFKCEITHWHPTMYEIYNEVCRIGTHGNILVLRSFLSSGAVLYAGNKETCPYSPDTRYLFGKFYYLEAV